MKKTLLIAGLATIAFFGCKKDDDNSTVTEDFATTEKKALDDFVNVVAIPQYNNLAQRAATLNSSINLLNTSSSQQSLDAAKKAWIDLRQVWEQCEGFLFGPVDEEEYDPKMDTWPTDYAQMDSLMASTTALNGTTIQSVPRTLRGFHPIEYILFGDHGSRRPQDITPRQKEYMVSLAADIQANCDALLNSWQTPGGQYGELVKTAGPANAKYTSRREIFLAILDGLVTICDEVGTGKMEDPLGPNPSSAAPQNVESPYSGNSVTDFKNNIIGLQNVYLCRYNGASGRSLSNLVAMKNQSLDNKIRTQITAAINSFDNITLTYEEAIVSQRLQIGQAQAALATLTTTLEDELQPFIVANIRD